jgi:hypothetical protein
LAQFSKEVDGSKEDCLAGDDDYDDDNGHA